MQPLEVEDYARKYDHVRIDRSGGVVELHLHTDGGSLVWTEHVQRELASCFAAVAEDPGNDVVLLTGSGESFCTTADPGDFDAGSASAWAGAIHDGQRLIDNLLRIEVPVIGTVNGPATVHAELLLLCDIALASASATFQDSPHFASGVVPGDGAQVVWMHVLGPQRGRYFLLTGQELSADQALELGVVSEVLPNGELLARARELAAGIAAKPLLARRGTRALLIREWRRLMHEQLSLGFGYEALGIIDLATS
jgi:enoyl-CoA hydratase/carnithine racemase